MTNPVRNTGDITSDKKVTRRKGGEWFHWDREFSGYVKKCPS